MVLILADLHWADRSSLLLLEFLASELEGTRLLIIGTYSAVEKNPQHPLADTLEELIRQRLFQRVLLPGLALEDVERFMEVTASVTPPRTLVEAIHEQTEGNPLFLTEVVGLLSQKGELTPQVDPIIRTAVRLK